MVELISMPNCSVCGEVYHKESKPSKIKNVCDNCSAVDSFVQRADDNEVSFRTRLVNYYKDTSPLIGYYHAKGLLNSIDGLRVEYDDSWGLIRASNTSPVLVLRFEASDQKSLIGLQTLFQQKLNEVRPELTFEIPIETE